MDIFSENIEDKELKTISVAKDENDNTSINNPTNYQLIGCGFHGAVFRLDKDRCVKIFAKEEYAQIEAKAYEKIKNYQRAPKIYKIGQNYIIMEYIEGLKLSDFLDKNGEIPEIVTRQLLDILYEMKNLGCTFLDIELQNIIITKEGILRVVDHHNHFLLKQEGPVYLFKGLDKFNLLNEFLSQAEKFDPLLCTEWKKSSNRYIKQLGNKNALILGFWENFMPRYFKEFDPSKITVKNNSNILNKRMYFASVVSNKSIFRAVAMYNSLEQTCKYFNLYVLCVEEEVYNILSALKLYNVTLIRLHEIEDTELIKVKSNRTLSEYCRTLRPSFLHYIMLKHPEGQYFALLDADLCFFENPEVIFKESNSAVLYLTDHRNSERFFHTYKIFGKYNTGFVGCRNSYTALQAIKWWRERCIEWCYERVEEEKGLYRDQRYVEMWEKLFRNVHVVRTVGANAAQWNLENYNVSYLQGDGHVYLNNEQLIFYHFSGLSIFSDRDFNLSYFYKIPEKGVMAIYIPYIELLSQIIKRIQSISPGFSEGFDVNIEVQNSHRYIFKI